MSTIVVKAMKAEDLPYVCRIEAENFSMPWSENSFLESLEREDTLFLTAVCDGTVAGYVGCYCVCGSGEITNVAVDEKFRRRGVAKKLLEILFEEAKERSLYDVMLEVRQSNAPAIALYTSMGFQKEGIRKNFYEKPTEDAVIMLWHP